MLASFNPIISDYFLFLNLGTPFTVFNKSSENLWAQQSPAQLHLAIMYQHVLFWEVNPSWMKLRSEKQKLLSLLMCLFQGAGTPHADKISDYFKKNPDIIAPHIVEATPEATKLQGTTHVTFCNGSLQVVQPFLILKTIENGN